MMGTEASGVSATESGRHRLTVVMAQLAALVLAAVVFPAFGPTPYVIKLMTEVLIYALWAMSLDILIGYTGLVSFGHAAYFGLGAYGTGLLIVKFQLSLLPALLGGVAIAAAFSLLVGIIIVRLSGIAFALLTLAVSMVAYTVVWQWTTLTGGDDGLSVSRPPLNLGVASFAMKSDVSIYYLVLLLFVVCAFLLWRFTQSPTGTALAAVRDNAVRAGAIGYNVARLKLTSFLVAGSFAGVSGSLYIILRSFASPDLLHWSASGHILIMTIVGGTGTLFGPVIGAAMMVLVEDKLSAWTEYWMLPFGLLFVLVVGFLPGGLAQLVRKRAGRR